MEECRKAIALFAQMAREDPSNPQLPRLRKIAEDRLAEVAARS